MAQLLKKADFLLYNFHKYSQAGDNVNRIKNLRINAKMSQAQLGKAIGCVGQTISKFEKEVRQLDPATICALCDLFGCTADYLLCRSETPLPAISDADARLLSAYHAASLRDRALVDQILAAWLPAEETLSKTI